MLTSRERLLRFFSGRPIDRIPIWLLAPFHPLGCYADIYNIPSYQPVVRRIEQGDCDTFDRRSCGGHFLYTASPDLKLIREMKLIKGVPHQFTHLTFRSDTLCSRYHRLGNDQQMLTYFIDDPAKLAGLLKIPYVPVQPDLAAYRREKAELGERGLFMMDLGDPLATLYSLMSATDFSIATATDYDLLLAFLDQIYPRVIDLYKTFLDQDIADCYFIVGCEFAGPPLVSPVHFQELAVRYVRGICDLIRSYGKIAIVHYHGQLREVLGGFRIMNPDGLHTVELPPVGNCTLQQARQVLGPDLALIGPIQYDDLTRLPAEAIESQVIEAIAAGSGGRFILSPTAGPYEAAIDERTAANYLIMIDTGLKHGRLG